MFRRRKRQVAPIEPRRTFSIDPNAQARFIAVLAEWMDESWVGHEVMTGTHIGEVLALEQHPTHHRTVLTLGTADGIETVDMHDHTTVTTDPQGVMK